MGGLKRGPSLKNGPDRTNGPWSATNLFYGPEWSATSLFYGPHSPYSYTGPFTTAHVAKNAGNLKSDNILSSSFSLSAMTEQDSQSCYQTDLEHLPPTKALELLLTTDNKSIITQPPINPHDGHVYLYSYGTDSKKKGTMKLPYSLLKVSFISTLAAFKCLALQSSPNSHHLKRLFIILTIRNS